MAGLPPDPEQELALDALFALDPADSYHSAAFEFAVIVPARRKTGLFKMAASGGCFTGPALVVWSAHEMSTTREAFRDLVGLIENCPALRKRLAPGPTNGIFSGNGNEMIELAPTPECPEGSGSNSRPALTPVAVV